MTKEKDIQIACNDYLNYLSNSFFFRHFHVPNEGKKTVQYHALMKKMGLRPGCPDIIIEYFPGKILYIELKNEKGRLSQYQKIWKIQSKAFETPHYIVKGNIAECLDQIKTIIENNIPRRS